MTQGKRRSVAAEAVPPTTGGWDDCSPHPPDRSPPGGGPTRLGADAGQLEEVHVGDVLQDAHHLAAVAELVVVPDVEDGVLAVGDGRLGRSEERRVGKECRSRWSPKQ